MGGKKSINLELANIVIKVFYKEDEFIELVKGYITNKKEDYIIIITEEMINKEKSLCNDLVSNSYLGLLAFVRAFASYASKKNILLMHCVVLLYKNNAYAFLAPSGVGKTTHAKLWLEYVGKDAKILCGDKAFVKIEDEIIVYSSMLNGKEGYGFNGYAPLKGICVIERNEVNDIIKLNSKEALNYIYKQVYIPDDIDAATTLIKKIISLCFEVPSWLLKCNKDISSAKLSFSQLTGVNNEAT